MLTPNEFKMCKVITKVSKLVILIAKLLPLKRYLFEKIVNALIYFKLMGCFI